MKQQQQNGEEKRNKTCQHDLDNRFDHLYEDRLRY